MGENRESAEGLLEETPDCRVKDIGLDGFAECLDVGPKACPYAMPFGYAFLCQNPRLAATVASAQRGKAGEAQAG